jgi:hypothetical protein
LDRWPRSYSVELCIPFRTIVFHICQNRHLSKWELDTDVENEETQRLKSMVADLSMSNELLREKIHRLEAGRPLVWRRSKSTHHRMVSSLPKA